MIPQDSGPAPEATYETTGLVADPAKTGELRESIQRALKTVFDPEIPVDIWELGLIYDVFVTADGVAAIRMTLTAPGCPAAQVLPSQVADAARTVAGVTDHLDGYLARRLKQETALGAMLDQVADSFTTAILLAMLVVTGGIPFAYLVIFLLREFWVGTVRWYGATVGIEIPSIALGKMATAVIYWAILTVAIIILPDMPARVVTPVHWIGLVGLGVGLAISCLTGWRYTKTLGSQMV